MVPEIRYTSYCLDFSSSFCHNALQHCQIDCSIPILKKTWNKETQRLDSALFYYLARETCEKIFTLKNSGSKINPSGYGWKFLYIWIISEICPTLKAIFIELLSEEMYVA